MSDAWKRCPEAAWEAFRKCRIKSSDFSGGYKIRREMALKTRLVAALEAPLAELAWIPDPAGGGDWAVSYPNGYTSHHGSGPESKARAMAAADEYNGKKRP